MSLEPGTRIGPYEIQAPIGAGGMGEVYRARDSRLDREVAVKILPASMTRNSERLHRFEVEARAAGQLDHPNILSIHDLGTHEGTPYIVAELLEGETLRERMGGAPMAPRRAVEYVIEIAHGLAAAHDKGIVHRDLKPENIFVTKDGRVKILDFGLAKLTEPEEPPEDLTAAPTRTADTKPGVVLGTVTYMSPEQAKGKPADARSDIFNLGMILYEMLSGRRPFGGESSVEVLMAIAKEDPPELSKIAADLPAGLEIIVRHCMEKSPEERFQSARDLAFQLEMLSGSGSTTGIVPALRAPRRRRLLAPLLAAAAVVAALGLGYFLGREPRPAEPDPVFAKLTYRQGTVTTARFTSDGGTILYAASWSGGPSELYTARPGGKGSRSLGIVADDLLSVSSRGEAAILLDARYSIGWMRTGTMATVPLEGGAPRILRENVQDADWSPAGDALATAINEEGSARLEFPPGNVLYRTSGWISNVRFSPDGRLIAFFDNPVAGDDQGRVSIVDLDGGKTDLTPVFGSADGLAWRPDGEEIWFSVGIAFASRQIFAVDLEGRRRSVHMSPGYITVQDISRGGKALVTQDSIQRGMAGKGPDSAEEIDLSWMDWSYVDDISRDGRTVLFTEQGDGGGPKYSFFVRGTDGSEAVRLGEGQSLSLSPDGRSVISVDNSVRMHLVVSPTGAGSPRLAYEGDLRFWSAEYLPDGRRALCVAATAEGAYRMFLLDTESSEIRQVSDFDLVPSVAMPSPDGESYFALGIDRRHRLFRLDGGEPTLLEEVGPEEQIVGWLDDGRTLMVVVPGIPLRVEKLDLRTRERTLWKELAPRDRSGLVTLDPVVVSTDGGGYVYGYRRWISTLYEVDGLVPGDGS